MSDFEASSSAVSADLPDTADTPAEPHDTPSETASDVEPDTADQPESVTETDAETAEEPGEDSKIEGIPEDKEMGAVVAELDDIDTVLKNLDKDSDAFDTECAAAEADGTIAERPALDTYWQTKSASA